MAPNPLQPKEHAAVSFPLNRSMRLGLVALLATTGLVATFYPTLFSGFRLMPNDPGDTLFINYCLEHIHRWLLSPRRVQFWSPKMFYPEPNVTAYSDVLLALVPFYTPWRLLGLAPDTALQLWAVTVALMNFAVAYWFFRKLPGLSELSSGLAALFFSFASPRLTQLMHIQYLPHFYSLLVIYGIWRAFQEDAHKRPVTNYLALATFGVVAQFYAAFYYGWFLGFCLLLACAVALTQSNMRLRLISFFSAHWRSLFLSGLVTALTLAPLAAHYLPAARLVGFRKYVEVQAMLPRLQSWFFLGQGSWLYGWAASLPLFSRLPMVWEHAFGLGLVTSAVLATTLYRERSKPFVRLFAGTSIAILLVVTLWPGHLSVWYLVFHLIPGAAAIRVITRFGLMLLLPAALALGLFVEHGLLGPRPWVTLGVAVFCLFEQGHRMPSFEKQRQREEVSALANRVDPHCTAFYYSPVNSALPYYQAHLNAMWASLQTNVPTVNGYSSNFPSQPLSNPKIDEASDESRIRRGLAAWAAEHGLRMEDICWIRPSGN